MPQTRQVNAASFSGDVLDFIRLLEKHGVRYLIVGGEAVIYHGYPRLTGDIDFFFERVTSNTALLFQCLLEFWDGQIPSVESEAELMTEGVVFQFGRPPHRIDIMGQIDGVQFSDAWPGRERVEIVGAGTPLATSYLGRDSLIKNKRATARPKDLDDIQNLE